MPSVAVNHSMAFPSWTHESSVGSYSNARRVAEFENHSASLVPSFESENVVPIKSATSAPTMSPPSWVHDPNQGSSQSADVAAASSAPTPRA